MKQLAISESFTWAKQLWPILKQFENDGVNYYKVVASSADIRNRNNRVYTSEELSKAASSLSERPLNINHDPRTQLEFPENEVLAARFEDGHVECIIQVADPKVAEMIDSGEINAVSIEGKYLDSSRNTTETEYPSSLHFQALALLTRDDKPGDPFTKILRESLPGKDRFTVHGEIMNKVILETREAEMSGADIDNLPDSAFAYIQPGGKKDDQGKTVPRSLRHLPYKGTDGKPNPDHVRNAIARLPPTEIPSEAKAEANRKLQAAAKEVGIETQQMQAKTAKDEFRIALEKGMITKAQYDLIVKEIGLSEDAADNSGADKDAIVDPARNEDGSFGADSSQQNVSNPAASRTTVQSRNQGVKTETNVDIESNVQTEGSPGKTMSSEQNIPNTPLPMNVDNLGVGDPTRTKPKMNYPESVNPLSITNDSTGFTVSANKVSSLMDALTNAETNVTTKIIPSISESKTQGELTQGEIKLSAQESNSQKVNDQPQAQASQQQLSISVKLDGAQELKQAAEAMANAVKESSSPKPQAKLSNTEASQPVQESVEVKEKARLDTVARVLRSMVNVKEDISASAASGALGQVWSPDMIILPPDLPANLRRFVQVKEIPKGSDRVHFTTITTPAFAALTDDTSPSDVTQTISEITATPAETGAKQRVSYQVLESATPDVVQAVERAFQAAALIDEDSTILTALDGATPAATLYGDESVTVESSITSSMTFKAARLASALREVQSKGYAVNPGDLVACLHPVQYDSLLKDTAISQYLYFGSAGPIQQGVIPQVYGVDVVRSTKVPQGTGSGSPAITTYHAQVFLKAQAKVGPNGLGVGGTAALGISRDLMVETMRIIYERALYIVASHRIAAGVLQPNALVHIYTA